MPSVRVPQPLPDGVSQATIGVRGGLLRSGFEETAEAHVPDLGLRLRARRPTAEQAFTGEIDRYVYSRYGNPTISMFEERLRLIEGAPAAFATATGMAAVFTALGALLGAGDRLVAARSLFGSCFVVCNEILPRWGVETVFVDGDDLSQWEEALSSPPRRCSSRPRPTRCSRWWTSPRSPSWRTPPGAKVVLDNVFATPLLQQGLPLGADVVVYSGTKHIDGQGRVLGGAILGDKEYIDGPVQKLMRHTGPAISAFNAWTLLKGLETLAVRVDYSNASAQRIAEFLEGHPAVQLGEIPVPGVASAVRPGQAADVAAAARWSPSSSTRPTARQAAGLRGARQAAGHRHLQQPGRRQVADHPPGHHHAPGDGPGGPGRHRAGRRGGAHLGRSGGHRGPDRRPRQGFELGVC